MLVSFVSFIYLLSKHHHRLQARVSLTFALIFIFLCMYTYPSVDAVTTATLPSNERFEAAVDLSLTDFEALKNCAQHRYM